MKKPLPNKPYIFISIILLFLCAKMVHAVEINIDFEDISAGTVLTDEYSLLGIQFSGATVFNPSMISNPPAGNSSNFILPSSGYNNNGYFTMQFIDPNTLSPISTPYVTLTTYLGVSGDVRDSYDIYWTTSSNKGPLRINFSNTYTYTLSDPEGITSIRFQDWGVNAFDNIQVDLNVSVVPEPISSILCLTGGTLLAGRRCLRRKR